MFVFFLLLPEKPIPIQNGNVRPGQYGVAGKFLTRAAAGKLPAQNAVAGIAIAGFVGVQTAAALTLQVGWTAAAVKTAFSKQLFIHNAASFSLRSIAA